jgi:galactose mutarotase-like enzyme
MSDWYQIENGFLTAQVTTKGAELKRLFHRAWNRELLWDGEDKAWERSSPILFPIVGKLKNDEYNFQGKSYNLSRHGFARDMDFNCTQADVHECEFSLSANSETFKNYPFLFELKAHFALEGPKLIIKYTVKNCDRQDIFFSIGAHPGFETSQIAEYAIQFEKTEEAYFLTKDGLLDNSQKVIFKNNRLELSKELFEKDALIFKKIKSTYIDLIHKPFQHVIRLSGIHAPYLGIWGKDAVPFICIEPWHGVADLVEHDQNLENKEGIIRLAENMEFVFTYAIESYHS